MIVTLGLISDTHGLLRPEALVRLTGSDCIVHAGDIGAPDLLPALARIAPVTAVRGNNDTADWARALSDTAVLRIGAVSVYVLHDVRTLDPGILREHRVVIAGHSHRPQIAERDGVLFVNPGSAGPRRFSLPVTVALLTIEGKEASATIEVLEVARPVRAAHGRAPRPH